MNDEFNTDIDEQHEPDVVLDLTVSDCYGATNTDSVTLTYACTGS